MIAEFSDMPGGSNAGYPISYNDNIVHITC